MMSAGGQVKQQPAGFRLFHDSHGVELILWGDWTVLTLGRTAARLGSEIKAHQHPVRVDVSSLGKVDSAGVFAIIKAVGDESALRDSGREDLRRLSDLVKGSSDTTPVDTPRMWLQGLFVRIGQAVVAIGEEAYRTMDFSGRLMVALGRIALHPRRLRLTPLFAVMEEAGINAVPIVMVMTFFIGAVIALVGANLLTTLGVSVFTVQLVGVAVLREFGVVIAAILLAGRSASAFAAQLGSMRMNQEVDAMQVMGVDRFEALVVPRVLAALLMTPLLTFCADIGGMLGGMIVSWAMIDIDPTFFIQRTLETVDIDHFWIGMSKAPFLALVISAAGCRHGLLVGGDTESLGRHVTAAVVQSIFLIIMFDAIFALIFMVLDL